MKYKICIVEDTPDLLDNLTLFLQLEGYDAIACKNGREALHSIRTEVPDLIITDLWMPEMDGFALIQAIKTEEHLSDIPIAVFSAAPLSESEKKMLDGKITGFIKKPITMDDLVRSINQYLKK